MPRKIMMEDWLDTAVSGIRFGPDRRAVRSELESHMEDKTADLRRVFPDIPDDEAQARALSAMGDAEELKKELARVHRPWLGYLWRASQVLMWGALAVFLLICVSGNDHYQSAGFPLWMDWTGHYPAPADLSPERAEVGGYTFQIVEAAYLDGEYLLTLRVSSPRFWERIDGESVLAGLTAVGADGTRYRMTERGLMSCERLDETGELTVIILGYKGRLARWDLFSQEFSVYIPAEEWEPGDWVTLELDSGKGGFALSAQVTERVEEP